MGYMCARPLVGDFADLCVRTVVAAAEAAVESDSPIEAFCRRY
eukprot:COSAG01_NODE_72581_length_252_cov_1.450980_2_plen_43_part_01